MTSLKKYNLKSSVIPCPACGESSAQFFLSCPPSKHTVLMYEHSRLIKSILFAGWAPPSYRHRIRDVALGSCVELLTVDNYVYKVVSKDKVRYRVNRKIYAQFKLISSWLSAKLQQGASILEVGCAEGHLVSMLQQKGFNAIGIEPSASLVNAGVNRHPGLNLVSGVYSPSSFPESKFDAIFSNHVFEHLADISCYIDANRKHLKHNGMLYIYTPCAEAIKERYQKTHIKPGPVGGGHTVIFSMKLIKESEIWDCYILHKRNNNIFPVYQTVKYEI